MTAQAKEGRKFMNPIIQLDWDETRKVICLGYWNPATNQLEFETVEDVPLEELKSLMAKFCEDYQARGLKILPSA